MFLYKLLSPLLYFLLKLFNGLLLTAFLTSLLSICVYISVVLRFSCPSNCFTTKISLVSLYMYVAVVCLKLCTENPYSSNPAILKARLHIFSIL